MTTLFDSIVIIDNHIDYWEHVSHLRNEETVMIIDHACHDFGLIQLAGIDDEVIRLWSINRAYGSNQSCNYRIDDQSSYITQAEFLDHMKDHYPDHFIMFLFHPELLEIVA